MPVHCLAGALMCSHTVALLIQMTHYSPLTVLDVAPVHSCSESEQQWHKYKSHTMVISLRLKNTFYDFFFCLSFSVWTYSMGYANTHLNFKIWLCGHSHIRYDCVHCTVRSYLQPSQVHYTCGLLSNFLSLLYFKFVIKILFKNMIVLYRNCLMQSKWNLKMVTSHQSRVQNNFAVREFNYNFQSMCNCLNCP